MVQRGAKPMPVLFVTQLVGLALGLTPVELGMPRHFVNTEPFIADLVQRAKERVAAEKKVKEEAAAKAAAKAAARREKVGAAAPSGAAASSGDTGAPEDGDAQ